MQLKESFVHRLHRPHDHDGSSLVLLHGTGGSETDLFPLGQQVASLATLLGVRGRSTDEGILRWFRRIDATHFDQEDLRLQADVFAAFLPGALASCSLDPMRMTLLGYSNGANFIAALMLLHPNLVQRAVLLRPMLVLDMPPATNLSDVDVLMVSGRFDPYGRFAPALEAALRTRGARVDLRTVSAAHETGPVDASITRQWLGERSYPTSEPNRFRQPGERP